MRRLANRRCRRSPAVLGLEQAGDGLQVVVLPAPLAQQATISVLWTPQDEPLEDKE
jgi:hypothetical protein